MEEPISRGEYRRWEVDILFEIELLLYRWYLSEFVFNEERQVSSATRMVGRSSVAHHAVRD